MLTIGTKVRLRGGYRGDGSRIEGVVLQSQRSRHPSFSDEVLVEVVPRTIHSYVSWFYQAAVEPID